MAVTSVLPHFEGQTGLRDDAAAREYTVVWKVLVDSPLDGPKIVIDGVIATLPAFPSDITYAIGNDVDTSVTLNSLVPKRTGDTRLQWLVTGKYSRPSGSESGTDEDGNPTSDPLQFRNDVQINFAQFQLPVEKATYIGPTVFTPRGAIFIENGAEVPVTNSAGVRFVPGETRDDSRMVITITKNLQDFPIDQAEEYKDAVNADSFNVTLSPRQTKRFQKLTVKNGNIGGSYEFTNEIFYWRVTYELHVNPDGWNRALVDRGVEARALLGDDDGKGGEINVLNDGEPALRRLTDQEGVPISDPVRFDGNGQPLQEGSPAIFMTYRIYNELPFRALNL